MKWQIEIPNFIGGFAPAWYLSTYPSYGNKNMAGDMQNVDLTDPTYVTQGPGLSTLTGGTVDTLIRGVLDKAVSADKSFAVGGSKFYELSSSQVASSSADPILPHTISGTAVAAEDLAYFQGEVYYSYSTTASGNVGKYDLTRDADTDFSDAWATAVVSASISASVPLPLEVGGNDFMYLGMKNRVSDYDGTTWTDTALDLPANCEIQDVKWNMNRLWVATNQPDLTGSNKVKGSIYIWDGVSGSWEDELRIDGRVGGMFIDNGVLYVFYQDLTSTGGYKLGFIKGSQIQELASFKGSLPQYYQITKYKGFIIWVGGEFIYAFGAVDKNLPGMIFQLADGGYSTVGGLAAPFGTPFVASWDDSTAYKIAKFSGYDTASNWKSLLFDTTAFSKLGKSRIDRIMFNFEKLADGAKVGWTLKNNQGTTLMTDSISFSADGAITNKWFNVKTDCENFRLELDWTNSSTANPFSIKNTKIWGYTLE